jgi:predicted nucleic acid-binding protein
MKDNYFVDTNVLVYLFDKSEKEKNKKAVDTKIKHQFS